MRFFEHANYDFIGKRRITLATFAAITLFAILPGLAFELTGQRWFNWGVDFTGGTLIQVTFKQPMTSAELRSVVEPLASGAGISDFGRASNEFLIRAQSVADTGATNVAETVSQGLRARYGSNFIIEKTEAVGPKVGNELQARAIIAVLLSFAATLIYLAFRIEWQFGVAAIVATINDILFTLGVLALFRLEFSLTTIAALLTIIGYSLNDKIVVFDRVRENLKASRREDYTHLVNRSINETLPRTVMTGGSVIAVLAVLYLVGGIAIRDFALLMFLGIVLGTFSSMFLAPVVLIDIHKRMLARKKKPSAIKPPARAGAAV